LLLASAQGDEKAAKARDLVEAQLSPAQRSSGQAAARNWKPMAAGSEAKRADPFAQTPQPPAPSHAAATSPRSTGTGFAISNTHLVTNAHVVEGCTRLTLGTGGAARVRAVDKRNDLALLESLGLTSFASLRSSRLRQGEAVAVMGFPLTGLLSSQAQITTGHVSALAGLQNDSRFIQITAPIQPGNSGGPLLDEAGLVAGVVVSKLNALKIAEITGDIPQNVNFAISPLVLQGFLDANQINYRNEPPARKLAIADIAQEARNYTFLIQCW
jgi:hypothetical protein